MAIGAGVRWSVLAIVLSLAIASCGGSDRPSVEEWRPIWDDVTGGIPTQQELGDPPDQDVCVEALTRLRTDQGSLQPTPDLAIDDVVKEWVRIAEQMFFECPPRSTVIPDLEYGYGELQRLQAEVEVVLMIDTDEQ